jgi:hypothetical protein
VPVLWAVGNERISGEVEAAVDSAVGAGLRYLQGHAMFTRVRAGGAARIRADGLIGAAYRHDTSRSADPQYTAAQDSMGQPLGTICLRMARGTREVWRFGDTPASHVDLQAARPYS